MKGYGVKSSSLRELDNTSFVLAVFGIIFLAIVAISIVIAGASGKDNSGTIVNQSEDYSVSDSDDEYSEEAPSANTEPNENDDEIKAPSTVSTYYKVIRVVDGDTIDINIDGQSVRVRLIGVNTPETVHPSKPVECFGKEASNYTNRMLYGKNIQLELDSSQDSFDSYNRLLAYVYIDGNNFNYMLIRNGYAYEYTYNVPYKYQTEFKKAQYYASANNIGLWNPNVCSN